MKGEGLFRTFLILRLGNKVITKMEMLHTLVLLGQIQVRCPLISLTMYIITPVSAGHLN